MYFNPIVAMLHNTDTDRYHPIIFREAPLPGPPSDSTPIRHKSGGHHTAGFDTREEAIKSIHEEICPDLLNPKLALSKNFPWDGKHIPAMTIYFGEMAGEVVPFLG